MNEKHTQPSAVLQKTPPGGMPQGKPPQKTARQWLADYRWVLLIAAADLLVWLFWPAQAAPVIRNTWDYFVEMVVILIPVAVLMGLFEVWVPKQLIGKYLGRESGWKGIFLAFLFGNAPTGPLYVAFPISAMLLKKGASPLNLVVFLNTWAAIKIPQLLVETKFLGPSFMLVRLALTVPAAIIMGWLLQTGIERSGGLDIHPTKLENIS
ncbi:MAG: permease [Anaerolineales bacterium]|nr:permease [Anaerolineales bacterium]